MYINRRPDRWMEYSAPPEVIVANGAQSHWVGDFQEVQYAAVGDWDVVTETLHIATLLNRTKHRYGPDRNHYTEVLPSSAVAVPGQEIHGGWDGAMRGRHLFISTADVEGILDEVPDYSTFAQHTFTRTGESSTTDPVIENLMRLLVNDLHQGCLNGANYGEHLISALVEHVHSARPQAFSQIAPVSRGAEPRVRFLIDRIHAGLASKILLSDLARECGISVPYLCRIFKDATGHSPHQYILSARIDMVKRLLLDPEISLSDVAFTAGFTDQSQMTTTFRKSIGVTPLIYRKSTF